MLQFPPHGEVPVIQTPPVGENLAAVHELHSTSDDPIVYVYILRVLMCFCARVFVVFNNFQFSQASGLFDLLSTIFKSRELSNVGKVHTDLRVYRPCQRMLDVSSDPLPRFHRGSRFGGGGDISHRTLKLTPPSTSNFTPPSTCNFIACFIYCYISIHVSFVNFIDLKPSTELDLAP